MLAFKLWREIEESIYNLNNGCRGAMAPAELSTEQWEVIVDLVKKESISILFVSFKEMIKNPDPRVKWAMDIMDQEGEVCTLIFTLGSVVCSRW